MRVLVVEDDLRMAGRDEPCTASRRCGHRLTGRADDAQWMVHATDYDVLVLDVMLPDLDGFELCRRLRADHVWTPIIMVTARDAVDDRVHGLDAGANDYLTKPFPLAELLAKLRAPARRDCVARPTVVSAGNLRLDPASHQVWRVTSGSPSPLPTTCDLARGGGRRLGGSGVLTGFRKGLSLLDIHSAATTVPVRHAAATLRCRRVGSLLGEVRK